MIVDLLSFTIVVVSQFIFFLIHAWSVGELRNVPKYLIQGCLIGVPFGIIFDLMIGKGVGIFTYELGFVWWFLVLNGCFSYGFMIANVILLFRHSLLHMYSWSVALGLTYELTNYYFPVWQWTFASATLEYLIVVLAAYAGLAWLMMIALRVVYNMHFRLVPF